MIKIENRLSENVINEYYGEMKEKIVEALNRGHGKRTNPFTGESLEGIFYIDNASFNINEEFLEELLKKPVSLNSLKDPNLINYLKTALLVYEGNVKVDKILNLKKQKITANARKALCKGVIGKYKNPWVDKEIGNCELEKIVSNNTNFLSFIRGVEKKLKILNDQISKIVKYEITPDLRHKIISGLGVNVCPYCNRNYISPYEDERGKLRTTADLDHFYPIKYFQLFALSLYNFIPSCPICNMKFKKARRMKILYPYEKGFEKNAVFKVAINNNTDFRTLIGDNDEFELAIQVSPESDDFMEIENQKQMLHLEAVYKIHKQQVREVLCKKQHYSQIYSEMIQKVIPGITKEKENLFIYGYTLQEDERKDRPLSKLMDDIING